MTVHASFDALPGDGFEAFRRDELDAAFLGTFHDGCGKRVLAAAFEARDELKERLLVDASLVRDADELRLALSERS